MLENLTLSKLTIKYDSTSNQDNELSMNTILQDQETTKKTTVRHYI